MKVSILFTVAVASTAHAIRIIQSNDDGWATSPTRLLYNLMNETNDVVLSCPADDMSGHGGRNWSPNWRRKPCQFNTCPADSKPWGHDPEHTELNWVNSYAATAMKWGVETFGPAHWDGKGPELAVSGINLGVNIWTFAKGSSTVGAAAWAINEHGIPAIAFSGHNKAKAPYYEPPVPAAVVYSELANKLVNEVIKTGKPYLPQGIILNVNFPRLRPECMSADDFRFVFTRVHADAYKDKDQDWCGGKDRSHEWKLLDLKWGSSMPCTVSMTVMDSTDKSTANEHWKHRAVMEKLKDIAECPIKAWWENDITGPDHGWKKYIGHRRPASDICNHLPLNSPEELDCRKQRDEGSIPLPDSPFDMPDNDEQKWYW